MAKLRDLLPFGKSKPDFARLVLKGHTNWVWGCAVDPQGQWIVSASEDKTLRVWDAETGALLRIMEGRSRALVHDILRRVDRNEYKRRQAPPGLRVTMKAFGIGRRLPIVMRWDRTAVEEVAATAEGQG